MYIVQKHKKFLMHNSDKGWQRLKSKQGIFLIC